MRYGVENNDYDVVILGGGVAGCVLASRLSEDPARSVCLVEAGRNYGSARTNWPTTIRNSRILPRDHVWESGVNPYRIRAKVLGGSSCLNGCWNTWGSPADFARWAHRGGPSWAESNLEPHRSRAADQMGLHLPAASELSEWAHAAEAAAELLGFETIETGVPGDMPGVGCPLLNTVGGERQNAAFAYLLREDRPNLAILSEVTIERLTVVGAQVTSASALVDHARLTLTGREFVLSCGAFGSPAVLLRSGIGPRAHLEAVGIPVNLDLPGVGENLSDHVGGFIGLEPTDELNAALAKREAAGALYVSRVLVRAASGFSEPGSWDMHILPTAGPPLFGSLPPGKYEAGISAFVMNPRSRGHVRLTDADPESPLDIDPCFLSDVEDHDLNVLREGLTIAEQFASSPPIAALADARDGNASGLSDDELRKRVGSYWHPVGTCAMGDDADPAAVVDRDARVLGLSNLRVVDASIFPDAPAANTQLPVLAVAEMIAATGAW